MILLLIKKYSHAETQRMASPGDATEAMAGRRWRLQLWDLTGRLCRWSGAGMLPDGWPRGHFKEDAGKYYWTLYFIVI